MILKLKPDFKEAVHRIEAWWHYEITDRIPVAVTALKDPVLRPAVPKAGSTAEKWWGKDFVLESAYARLTSNVYAGEALPVFIPDLGENILAGLLGGDVIFSDDDTKIESSFSSLSGLSGLSLDPENAYYLWLKECSNRALKKARKTYLVGMPCLQNPLDCIAALISPGTAADSSAGNGELLAQTAEHLQYIWKNVYAEFSSPLLKEYGGTAGSLNLFRKGTFHCIALKSFSPEQTESILPVCVNIVRVLAAFLDSSLFCIPSSFNREQISSILDITPLTGICIDRGNPAEAVHIIEAAQTSGKCVYIKLDKHDIEPLLKEFPNPEGVMLSTHARNEAEAEEIVRKTAKFT